jgi:hypothetical protein
MEVAAVSLSSWEHKILSRIAEELPGADSKLASLVAGFNRLVAGEEMPFRPQVAGLRRSRPRGGYRRRRHPSMTWRWLTAAWFLTTAALIAIALVLNLVNPGPGANRVCAQSRAASCTGSGLGALSVLSPGLGTSPRGS